MDRRVFEPRPTGNDARRRNALTMAIVILAAGAFWLYSMRTTFAPTPVPVPSASAR